MGEIVLERCHGIAEYLEIGTNGLVGEVCGCRGGKVSAGTAMGMDRTHYLNIGIRPMAYGQALTLIALVEAMMLG